MNQMITKEEMLSMQYDILGHYLVDNAFTEIRIIRNGTQVYCDNKEEFIKEASKFTDSDAYVGVNPRSVKGGLAEHVSYVTCIFVDIDPANKKGEPSTDEQLKSAVELGHRITQDFPGSLAVSSGSGCHVYFPLKPIRVDNREALAESLKKWNDAIRGKYATKELRVDSMFDLPRVIRMWGSYNTKSKRICAPIGNYNPEVRFAYEFSQVKEVASKNVEVVEDLDERFGRLCRSNKRLSDIVGGKAEFPSRSEADFAFIAILHESKFSPEDILSLASKNPLGKAADGEDISRDIQRVCKKLVSTQLQSGPVGLAAVRSLREDSAEYVRSLSERRPGLRTGISRLDTMVSGLRPGKLYIFAARPTEGKTTLIVQILTAIAEQGKTCLFYPTEVGADPIYDKIVSAKSGINLKKFQNGNFTDEETNKIKRIMPQVEKLPILVMEDFAVTPEKCLEGVKKYAPQVLAVDFLQSMAWKNPDSVGEKYDAVYRLKKIAIDYNIPVILASQLNRGDGKADLRQLKGTAGLEELGDVISFIYQTDKLSYPVPTDLLVMKSKYSATGLIKLRFHKSICKLEVDETWKENE